MADTFGFFQQGVEDNQDLFFATLQSQVPWAFQPIYLILCMNSTWTPATATKGQVLSTELVNQFGYVRQALNVPNGTWNAANKRDERSQGFTETASGGTLQADAVVLFRSPFSTANAVVTVDAAANTFTTATAHGLSNGDEVVITSDVALPGGISADTVLFVINKTTTTYQVSATSGGAAIDITNTGSGTIRMRYATGRLIAWAKLDPYRSIPNGAAHQFIPSLAGLHSGYVSGV